MAIADVLKALRDLKRAKVVSDYILFGSVAVMVHTRPFFTHDVDIGLVVKSDTDFVNVFRHLSKYGNVMGHAVVIQGTAAEIFPVDISPIIQDSVSYAVRKRVEGVVVKVVPPEHLLLEALRVFRPNDKGRVFLLDEAVDRGKLRSLFRRLDHDGTLRRCYQSLVGKAS